MAAKCTALQTLGTLGRSSCSRRLSVRPCSHSSPSLLLRACGWLPGQRVPLLSPLARVLIQIHNDSGSSEHREVLRVATFEFLLLARLGALSWLLSHVVMLLATGAGSLRAASAVPIVTAAATVTTASAALVATGPSLLRPQLGEPLTNLLLVKLFVNVNAVVIIGPVLVVLLNGLELLEHL